MQADSFVNFYQTRDFSQLINSTFQFLRLEFKNLAKLLLIYNIPFIIILGILGGYNQWKMYSEIGDLNFDFSYFSVTLALEYFILLFFYTMVTTISMSYIREYIDSEGNVDIENVKFLIKNSYFRMLLLSFLYALIVLIATLILIIPGIYLSVALSLSVPAIYFYDKSLSKAFNYSINLVKDYWWFTFGILALVYVIIYALQMALSIPASIITMFQAINFTSDSSELLDGVFGLVIYIFSFTLTFLGYLALVIPNITISLHYHNLKDRKEENILLEKIESIDPNYNPQQDNEQS